MRIVLLLIIGCFSSLLVNGQLVFTDNNVSTDGESWVVKSHDVDGDGYKDIVASSSSRSQISFWKYNGNHTFTKKTIGNASGPRNIITIDLDNDNDVDIVTTSTVTPNTELVWFENDGSENFTKHVIILITNTVNDVNVADINGDNEYDIILPSYHGDFIRWYENDGAESFTQHTISTTINGPRKVIPLDLDNDMDIDIVCASADNGVSWFENNGSQVFTENILTNAGVAGYAVFPIDLDNDNDIDIVSGIFDQNHKVSWLENDGSENFSLHAVRDIGGTNCVFARDIDLDGNIDILFTDNIDNKVIALENDGSNNFNYELMSKGVVNPMSVIAEDIDIDGDIDIFSGSISSDDLKLWENKSITDKSCKTLETYGPPESFPDRACASIYNALTTESYLIPLKIIIGDGMVVNISTNQVEDYISFTSSLFQSQNLNIELSIVELIRPGDDDLSNCSFNIDPNCTNSMDNDLDLIELYSEEDVINIFILDSIEIYANYLNNDPIACDPGFCDKVNPLGYAPYPWNDNFMILAQEEVMDDNYMLLAHEIGHSFGLYHTFENCQFLDNSESNPLGQDGIFDTEYDDFSDPQMISNMMSYEEYSQLGNIQSLETGFISPCQIAKIINNLFECRSNLCGTQIPEDYLENPSNIVQTICKGEDPLPFIAIDEHYEWWNYDPIAQMKTTIVAQGQSFDPGDLAVDTDVPGDYYFFIHDKRRGYNEDCGFVVQLVVQESGVSGCCWDQLPVDLNNGLIAYYPFNGNADDKSGNGHDGSVVGATLTTDRYGNAQGAYSFNGINQWITLGGFKNHTFTNTTFNARVKWEGINSPDQYAIISNYNGTDQHIGLRMRSAGKAVFFYDKDGTQSDFVSLESTSLVNDGDWHMITGILKSNNIAEIYVDGVFENSTNEKIPTSLSNNTAMYIGRDGLVEANGTERWIGKIDDIKIYDRALNCNEIQALYDNCKVDLNQGLVAYYPFNGDATDASGNGYDGIVNGPVPIVDRFGNLDAAFNFDGVDDFIELHNFNLPASFSISIWANVDQSLGDKPAIIDKWTDWRIVGEDGTPDEPWLNGQSGLEFSMKNHTNNRRATGTNNFNQNQWANLIAIYDHNSMIGSLYIGGSYVGEFSLESRNFNTNKVLLGLKSNYVDGFLKGKLDDVRIYDRVLNECEIDALYNDNCIKYLVVDNQNITENLTIYARQLVELSGVSVTGSSELTVISNDLLISGDVTVLPGNKITLIKEDGCVDNYVADIDGNIYKTIKIGNQIWMAENLNVGNMVSRGITMSDNGVIEKYCYNNDPMNCEIYGGLYQWDEIMQFTTVNEAHGICPTGWHIPSDNEWAILIDYLDGISAAGGKLKETGTTHWNSPNTGATNSSGFTALPGGYSYSTGFSSQNNHGNYWSSTENNASTAFRRGMHYHSSNISRDFNEKIHGFSVRCIKD